uniref:MFS domain-containing protein n=1 Tax=Mesocestoides corti TaxID=53468 RepID=A0A5K3G075_MESCO
MYNRFYLSLLALGIGVIAFYNPFMKSILTGSVRIDEQGRLLSTYAFCEVTGMLCGTTLQPMFYAATLAAFPGAVFLFSSGLLFVGVCFVLTISFLVLRGRVR